MTALDLYGDAFRADPYAVLAELREQDWQAETAAGQTLLSPALHGSPPLRLPRTGR